MDNLRIALSLSPAEAKEFWLNGMNAVVAAAGEMPETLKPAERGTWIIQRCTEKWIGPELQYEDFPTLEGLMTREQMVVVLDRVNADYRDEFKGHNTAACSCHKYLHCEVSAEALQRTADRPGPQESLSVRSRQGATVDGLSAQAGSSVGGELQPSKQVALVKDILFRLRDLDVESLGILMCGVSAEIEVKSGAALSKSELHTLVGFVARSAAVAYSWRSARGDSRTVRSSAAGAEKVPFVEAIAAFVDYRSGAEGGAR